MAWRRRSIRMPGRFDPARWEITAGMGVREIVLVSAAAGQAIWLVFLTPALPFVVRLVVAVLVALLLLGVAMVPIKDKPVEYHLLKFIGYRLRAMGRVYRTARREDVRVGRVAESHSISQKDNKHVNWPLAERIHKWQWTQPNPTLVVMMFLVILVSASVIIFAGQ